MKPQFITQNELSRETGVPVSRINAAVEAGLVTPAGRAGTHKHSPVIFNREDLPAITATLTSSRPKASIAGRARHTCKNAAEVLAKAEAFFRAQEESR
jgi:hypothetical protein